MKNNPLKDPSRILLIFVYLITLAAAVISVVLSAIESDNATLDIIRYIAYFVAAIGLAYSIYTFIVVIPKMKKRFVQWSKKYAFTDNLVRNY
ncbi:MAG: hypothetical protein K2N32_02470, partial [Clostridia bacterium]|nr:hypothetical protein [Clostridia bacterium]